MAKLKIQVDPKDLKRITNKLNNLQQYVGKDVVQDVLYRNANLVVNEMKREVPVDTGRLKRNIHSTKDSRGVTLESEAISPNGHKVNYAPIIDNYGGRFAKGLYYWTNGIARMIRRVRNELQTDIRAILSSKYGSTRQGGKTRTYTPRK